MSTLNVNDLQAITTRSTIPPKMIARPYNLRPYPIPSLRAQEAGAVSKCRPQKRIKIKLVNYSIDRLAALYQREKQEENLRQEKKVVERELRYWQRKQRQQQHRVEEETLPCLIKVYRAGRLQSIRDTTTNEIIYHAVRDANKPILTTYIHGKCVAVTDWRGPTNLYVYGVSHPSR